jgi:hypothetical protein
MNRSKLPDFTDRLSTANEARKAQSERAKALAERHYRWFRHPAPSGRELAISLPLPCQWMQETPHSIPWRCR